MRDRLTCWASIVFVLAALVGVSNPPSAAYSQPDGSSEVWCKAHNSDASAASCCIEAERGFGPSTRRATENHLRPGPLSGNLPLPRPRPQAAPHPTPEYVQATGKPQKSDPMPSSMRKTIKRCHLVPDLRNDSRKLAPHRRYPFIVTLIDLRSGDPRAKMHRPQACSRLRPDQATGDTPGMELRIGTARALDDGFEIAGRDKTEYTEATGYNSVSSVRRDEKHIVAAVLGVLNCAR